MSRRDAPSGSSPTRPVSRDDAIRWRVARWAELPTLPPGLRADLLGPDLGRWESLSRSPDPERARRFLAGRMLVRDLLAGSIDAVWPGYAPSAAGTRPTLAGGAGHFSVSYSGELVAVAVSVSERIGIDVEVEKRALGHAGLVRRLCSSNELRIAESLRGERRTLWLLRLWASKEALMKASGTGLRQDLTRLDIGGPTVLPDSAAGALAVAVAAPDGSAPALVHAGFALEPGTAR